MTDASSGYVPFAAQTDLRMKAVATVSGACVGQLAREGLKPKGALTRDMLQENLKAAGKYRREEAKTGKPVWTVLLPLDASQIPDGAPDLFKEGFDYYRTPRGQHPRATCETVAHSVDLHANFDAFAFVDLISPRPLLMIIGEKADSGYFSRNAIEKAKEPKELFVIKGKTHVALYDQIEESLPKLADFFVKNLT